MVATGRVLAARAPGRLAVELTSQDACPGCRCGRLMLMPDRRRTELLLDVDCQRPAGEEILVKLPATAFLRAALLLHGLPLVGLLFGAVVAAVLGSGDLGCAIGAVAGLSGTLLLVSRIQRRWYRDAAKGLRVESIA